MDSTLEVEPGGATDDAERGGLGGEPRLSAERDPASGGGQRLTVVTNMTTTNSTTLNNASPLLARAAASNTATETVAGAVAIQSTDRSGREATLTSFLAKHNLLNYEKQILDKGFESIHDLVELKEEEVDALGGVLGMKTGAVQRHGNSNTTILTDTVTVTDSTL